MTTMRGLPIMGTDVSRWPTDPASVDAAGSAYSVRQLVSADLWTMCSPRQPSWRVVLAKLAVQPRFRAILMYRAAGALHRKRVTRPLAGWLTGRILRACAAELSPGARIGPGLCLTHTTGLVIGEDVVAGRDLTLHQGVTLGDRRPGCGQPTIGDGVYIGAGAKVLGPITVGDGAVIAAGAVVLADVPHAGIAAGVPARLVGPSTQAEA
jgi:serine O-acetyltransferase